MVPLCSVATLVRSMTIGSKVVLSSCSKSMMLAQERLASASRRSLTKQSGCRTQEVSLPLP